MTILQVVPLALMLLFGQKNYTVKESTPAKSDVQVIIGYVHGTTDTEKSITDDLVNNTSQPYKDRYTKVFITRSFNWNKYAWLGNQPWDRTKAALGETGFVGLAETMKNQIKSSAIDGSKPIKIVLIGHSHGGNVAIQAITEIGAWGIKNAYKLNFDLITCSTPAYQGSTNIEDPNMPFKATGSKMNHYHFNVEGDATIRAALGAAKYTNSFTRNFNLPDTKGQGSDSHGAIKNLPTYQKQVATIIGQEIDKNTTAGTF